MPFAWSGKPLPQAEQQATIADVLTRSRQVVLKPSKRSFGHVHKDNVL
jgi:hypothetical protein